MIYGKFRNTKIMVLDSPIETPYKSIHETNIINFSKFEESLSQYKG